MKEISGTVLDIQRMSTEDGPGLRTTIFLKGCTLACEWCHNPESISFLQELHWLNDRCIGCKSCIKACKFDAISLTSDVINIDKEKCTHCFACEEACPSIALEVKGKRWLVKDLTREAIKDVPYFGSAGGVTVSGGEAMAQPLFTLALFEQLKAYNIHTALDTCGMCKEEDLLSVIPYTDLVLYDLKIMDSGQHEKYTGKANIQILNNVKKLAEAIREGTTHCKLWIRTPIIPNATANEKNILEIGQFINNEIYDVTSKWELCTFNNLCKDKYKRMYKKWKYEHTGLLEREEIEMLAQKAAETIQDKLPVCWSGAVKNKTEF